MLRLSPLLLLAPVLALAQADPSPTKTPSRLDKLLMTPTPTPAATKTPTRLEKLLMTPTATPAAAATTPKSTKKLDELLRLDPPPRPEICASLDQLAAARKNAFESIKTNERTVPVLGKTWESAVTPKGAIGRCSILGGATGAFVTCDMSEPLSKTDAAREYEALLTTVSKCFEEDAGSANDDPDTGERATDFGSDKTGFLGAVQVRMTVDGVTHETCQVQIRVHE